MAKNTHVPPPPPPHLVHVMFRPVSYCHVPSNLGNRQLEQGRISVIGKSVFFFIAAMCWDTSYEYLVVLFQFIKHHHCVKGSFGLYFGCQAPYMQPGCRNL